MSILYTIMKICLFVVEISKVIFKIKFNSIVIEIKHELKFQ